MKVEGVKLQEQCEALCSVCLTDGLFATAVLLNGNRRLAGLNEDMAGEGIEETKIQSRHKYSLEYYLRRLDSQLNSIPLVSGNFPASSLFAWDRSRILFIERKSSPSAHLEDLCVSSQGNLFLCFKMAPVCCGNET